MKKLFIVAVVLITGFSVNKLSAQTGPLTATTTLNVTLNAVQSITVNSRDSSIKLHQFDRLFKRCKCYTTRPPYFRFYFRFFDYC